MASANKTRHPGRPERILFWIIILALTVVLIQGNWLWRLDNILYDAQLHVWSRPAPDDIVIISIDEESLGELGRWPWSRDVHARLIKQLTRENARAIAIDIIFSEPSTNNTAADRKLAQAISQNARVVLPVLVEQSRNGGQLIETLPISILTQAATALGHVHVEIDQDGIARSVFLREGLGEPHWSNLGLALLQIADPNYNDISIGTHNTSELSGSPLVWARDKKIMIAYAGPPGHFQRIPYSQVLQGRYAPGTFANKLVLIGATAEGLGDLLPTPVAGYNKSMPGVEINANIIDTIRNGINLREMSKRNRMWISVFIILIPAFLFAHLTPRWNLIVTIALIGFTLILSFLLLRILHIWFPPSPILLALILSYPLWSWRRLENAMRYLNDELSQLHSEQFSVPSKNELDVPRTMQFLTQILPVAGWALFDMQGNRKDSGGDKPLTVCLEHLIPHQWNIHEHSLWLDMSANQDLGYLGLSWDHSSPPDQTQQALLNDFLERYQSLSRKKPHDTHELVQARIQQVQQATDRLRALRQFIIDVISQMSDGVLVVDPLGNIILSNESAKNYLADDDKKELNGLLLTDTLEILNIQGTTSWPVLLKKVLLEHHNIQIDTRHKDGRDLLVQITPLDRSKRELGGFIVNLSDISPLKASERKRSELLGFLSHDLRSPLVSLLALLEISRSKNSDPEQLMLLNRMESYANNTVTLAEEFLQLAHAESGENIQFSDVDLSTITYNALEHMWAQASEKGIALQHDTTVEEAWIHADAKLVERALINLLSNAIKYSPAQSEVLLSLHRYRDKYYCCIKDQGCGISKHDTPRLFDRFYRVKQEGQAQEKGAGLGLAFVQAVALRHDGEVTVSSELGQGSEFCLILSSLNETV